MPQPAPARFDSTDRNALHTSLATALGPALTLGVLIVGYALSARVCHANIRTLMAVCVVFGALGSVAAATTLVRITRGAPEHSAIQGLRQMAIGLQVFCLLVMLAYGVALATVAPCG
jgi:hypothetical protein